MSARHISLLRGINVGGHNLIAMARLRAIYGSLGCAGVVTSVTTLFDAGSGTTLKVADSSKLTAGDYVMVTDCSGLSSEKSRELPTSVLSTITWPAVKGPIVLPSSLSAGTR